MISTCRSSARIASNAIPSCSYITQRTVWSATKRQTRPDRVDNGYGDFVNRLKARQSEKDHEDGSTTGLRRRRAPLTVTVKGLKPHDVIERVNVLLAEGKLDHAITMVESLPLDAINVVVWNVLISEAIKAERHKLAFELYYDMKRRHIQPNTRTFTTLFVGLSKIDDWAPYSNILDRVFKAYDQLLVHFEKLRLENRNHYDINPWPINGFLTLLGKAGHYAKMWDVFFSMDDRLSPDEVTYSIMLRALKSRTSLDKRPVPTSLELEASQPVEELLDVEKWGQELGAEVALYMTPKSKTKSTPESVHYKNAADARVLWDHLIRASKERQRYPVAINGMQLTPLLSILALGKPTDQSLAFEIIEEFIQMESPGPPVGNRSKASSRDRKTTPNKGVVDNEPVPLSPPLFTTVLDVCIQSARVEAVIKYFQMVTENEELKGIVDSRHMEQILKAFAMRRTPKGQTIDAREAMSALSWMLRERTPNPMGVGHGKLDPRTEHFIYALTAAWRGADMASALHIFERVTKISPATYMKPDSEAVPIRLMDYLPSRYLGCLWNVTCMALLVKTADTTGRQENMRIAMRILRHTNMLRYFFHTERAPDGNGRVPIQEKYLAAQKELASRTIRILDRLLAHANASPDSEFNNAEELKQWAEMKKAMEGQLQKVITNETHRAEDKAREEELKKGRQFGAREGQLLVKLKGRRSEWSTNQ